MRKEAAHHQLGRLIQERAIMEASGGHLNLREREIWGGKGKSPPHSGEEKGGEKCKSSLTSGKISLYVFIGN